MPVIKVVVIIPNSTLHSVFLRKKIRFMTRAVFFSSRAAVASRCSNSLKRNSTWDVTTLAK